MCARFNSFVYIIKKYHVYISDSEIVVDYLVLFRIALEK
jgi:hypothetical protein